MTGPATFDDTSTDYKRLETEQFVQDHDAAPQTADLTTTAARHLVNDLADEGVVTPVRNDECSFTSQVARHSTRSFSSPCFIVGGRPHMAVTRRMVDTATARRMSLAIDRSSRVQSIDAEADGDRVDMTLESISTTDSTD